jgi:hypothetical protein
VQLLYRYGFVYSRLMECNIVSSGKNLLAFRETVVQSILGSKVPIRIFMLPVNLDASDWCNVSKNLTLSLLMSYIYGAPSKVRNLMSYIYGRDFLLGILLLEPRISLIYS